MYDILFLGGGLNYAGAVVAAKKGLKVALIERDMEHIGGTCLNNGCIPSKHLLNLAKVETQLKNEAFVRHKDRIKLDIAVAQKDTVVAKAHRAIEMQCSAAGVELIEGEGFITQPNTIEVGDKTYQGSHIVIGTGSTPFIPEGIFYDKEAIITSDEVLNLTDFPDNIAIYGSGAIGLEMASFFAACGVETTLIFRRDHISNKLHPTLLEALETLLENLGVTLMPNTTILEAQPHQKRAKITTNKDIYEFDKLLVATGRRPNTSCIKLGDIDVDRGIVTDDFFQTTLPNHWAIGDCNGKLLLAHAARAQVLNVVDRILGTKKRLNLTNIPKFIYSLPLQYAAIGMTKAGLEAQGVSYKEGYFPLSALALAQFDEAKRGGIVLYSDEEGFVIGAEILAPEAQELISTLSAALAGQMDAMSLLEAVFAHPTFSEGIERAARRLR
ncbi:MAG: NAD(P)/FAD-dependent oxidoreductase [Epsilonproteobacteria bacterium]|nr:NAD(P)/FAD-dependent oxidoreductase [Campylobacterota bacterium]NPA64203.1 NAD(P)/FAD-dependent oxidoreductase [Campylobacterota bacterium]